MPVRDLSNTESNGSQLNDIANSKRRDFSFPFKPYSIQLDLMNVTYDTLENGKFALLESPTGTGKSLSLICSTLTWLSDHKSSLMRELSERKEVLMKKLDDLQREEDLSGDWLSVQTKKQDINNDLVVINQEIHGLERFDERSKTRWRARLHGLDLNDDANSGSSLKISSLCETNKNSELIGSQSSALSSQSSETQDDEDIEKSLSDQIDDQFRPKIYYASRTHSQLSQFISEVKKTKFADSTHQPAIRLTPLASRANLCIHPDVVSLRDPAAINERCIEMQRETNKEKKCPYIKLKKVNDLKENILSSVYDIEDIVSRGKMMGSCPYFATRMAVSEAELVVLPYNNLLHQDTRKASSLNLKDSIIVLDEAHNILETICSIHSATITLPQLVVSHTTLSRYYVKYVSRMNPKNASVIKMTIQCITAILRYLIDPKKSIDEFECATDPPRSSTISAHEEFMFNISKFIGIGQIGKYNIFKITDYFNRSQLARKLIGFYQRDETVDLNIDISNLDKESIHDKLNSPLLKGKQEPQLKTKKRKLANDCVKSNEKNLKGLESHESDSTSLKFLTKFIPSLKDSSTISGRYPLFSLLEFLKSLTTITEDGRVLTDFYREDMLKNSLKFILLNPSSQFGQMTKDARSIVLAGGTMQPFNEFVDLLFGPLGVSRERLTLFSCGHVINPNQIFMASLSHGPSGKPLELSYKTRSSLETIDEYGRTILNLSIVCPSGMVCFLPSYDYEQLCYNRWKTTGIIASIEAKSKQVFREPRQTSHLKPLLDEYARVVEKSGPNGRGALLLCVVGGKMSEGINFNDDLGRCVIMVGLPYANIKSCELKQRMSYYDASCKISPTSESTSSKPVSAGQQYYENLCLKGINQSIGRAIRHKGDYAAIVLLDRRYSCKASIKEGLPTWMQASLSEYDKFGPMFSRTKTFFNQIENHVASDKNLAAK